MIHISHTNIGSKSYYEIIGKNGRPMIFKFSTLEGLKSYLINAELKLKKNVEKITAWETFLNSLLTIK